jgi:hypothetical protein
MIRAQRFLIRLALQGRKSNMPEVELCRQITAGSGASTFVETTVAIELAAS